MANSKGPNPYFSHRIFFSTILISDSQSQEHCLSRWQWSTDWPIYLATFQRWTTHPSFPLRQHSVAQYIKMLPLCLLKDTREPGRAILALNSCPPVVIVYCRAAFLLQTTQQSRSMLLSSSILRIMNQETFPRPSRLVPFPNKTASNFKAPDLPIRLRSPCPLQPAV